MKIIDKTQTLQAVLSADDRGLKTEVSCPADVLTALDQYPIVIFKGGTSLEILEEIAALFGGAKENPTFADIRDIKIDPSARNCSIALSAEAHPPHTDGTFSTKQLTVFMLQCVQEDDLGGGNGLYWGIDEMLAAMPRPYLEILLTQSIVYSRVREDGRSVDKYEGPILFYHNDRISIRWRFDSQVRPKLAGKLTPEQADQFEAAIAWILNYLTTEPPTEISYTKGDIVICNNLTALHGRRSLKGNSRHFRRVWLELI